MFRLLNKSFAKQLIAKPAIASQLFIRSIQSSSAILAKNDTSTIDSYKLPSQTSINEWEFKYDFIPKMSEPKIPPVTPEAVKQDIAQDKKADVEKELFNKELASSVKVEANSANVVHGGESVRDEPEYLQDRGSRPIDVSSKLAQGSHKVKKPANRDKYIQTSINPNINQSDVINLGENEVDHKASPVDKQTPIVEDFEHENLNTSSQSQDGKSESKAESSTGIGLPLALIGLGSAGYYFYTSSKTQKK